jgi:hypothetical protein
MFVRQPSWVASCYVDKYVKIITQETSIAIEPTTQNLSLFKEGIPKNAQNCSSDTVTFVQKLTNLKERKEGRKSMGGEGSVYTMRILP